MEAPPSTGSPDSFFPAPSPKFTEDLLRYKAKRQETWYGNTDPSKRRIVGTDGEPRTIDVRTLRWRPSSGRVASKEEIENWRLEAQAQEARHTTVKTAAKASEPTKADTRNVPQDRWGEQEDCAELSKEVAEPSRKLSDAPLESQVSS